MESFTGTRDIHVKPEVIDSLYAKKYLETKLEDRLFDKRLRFPAQNEYITLMAGDSEQLTTQSALTILKGTRLVLLDNHKNVSGITARNREQRFALNALMDDSIKVVVLTGRAGTGKAQPLNARILTPSGWTNMGSLKPGGYVLTPDGKPSKIISIHPQGRKAIFRVGLSDGSYTECCKDHLWLTRTQKDRDSGREGTVKSLEEIMETLRYGLTAKRNHSIPMVETVDLEQYGEQTIDPYLMGVLLGDGSMSVGAVMLSSADTQICDIVSKILSQYNMELNYASGYDYRLVHKERPSWKEGNYIKNKLKEYGLYGKKSHEKFIPEEYEITSSKNREALLQGLLDSDGTIDKRNGTISFSSSSLTLAEQVRNLVQSLGGKATLTEKEPFYTYNGERQAGKLSWIVNISLPNKIQPFRLDRKMSLIVPKTKYPPQRYIDSVQYIGVQEAQCILIDDPKHLYVTDQFIVTHNTLLTLATALDRTESKDTSYNRIILTRPMSWVGRHGLGALPGDVDEKFRPYLENYMCNLEYMMGGNRKTVGDAIAQFNMEFIPIQLIRGASWAKSFIIADEVQVLTHDEMVTLGTRVGEDSKIVIMGDLGQRDENIAKEKTGIYKFINSPLAQSSPLVATVDLVKCERSEVSALFADVFEV